jgi:hypothetical protein
MDFAQSVKANSKKLLANVNKQCYTIAKELFLKAVELSPSKVNPGPWATGLLVNQWYPNNGKSFSSDVGTDTSPYGASSISRIKQLAELEFMSKDGVVTLSNNVDHAYRAEKLGWTTPPWSGKSGKDGRGSPYAMVSLSIQFIKAKY